MDRVTVPSNVRNRCTESEKTLNAAPNPLLYTLQHDSETSVFCKNRNNSRHRAPHFYKTQGNLFKTIFRDLRFFSKSQLTSLEGPLYLTPRCFGST